MWKLTMEKICLLLAIIPFLLLSGCHDKNKTIDKDGVPIVTDIKHLVDANGKTMTTEEFLKKWCPGENKTPITNQTCVMVKNQRYVENSTNSMHH